MSLSHTTPVPVLQIDASGAKESDALMIAERQLTVYYNAEQVASTRWSGAYQLELAVGMLFAHGWITQSSDLETLDFQQEGDEVRVVDRHGAAPLSRQSQPLAAKERSRTFPPDQIPIQPEHPPFTFRLPASQINLLFDELVKRSRLHQTTRCTHSGALSDGNALLVLCEDVGRHNVADMLIGYALLNRIDLSDKLVVRTGRVALEIAEKFERAGLKMLLSLSVPTLGALEFARERGICLVSARRDRTILVFNGREHIVLESCV